MGRKWCRELANFPDDIYEKNGAKISNVKSEIWSEANVLLKINPPTDEELELLNEGTTLISFAYPARNESFKGTGRKD